MFHDVLHGFQVFRVTKTAVLKDELLQKVVAIREAVLFEVFLDLQKAYDALYWDICLEIGLVDALDFCSKGDLA